MGSTPRTMVATQRKAIAETVLLRDELPPSEAVILSLAG